MHFKVLIKKNIFLKNNCRAKQLNVNKTVININHKYTNIITRLSAI